MFIKQCFTLSLTQARKHEDQDKVVKFLPMSFGPASGLHCGMLGETEGMMLGVPELPRLAEDWVSVTPG